MSLLSSDAINWNPIYGLTGNSTNVFLPKTYDITSGADIFKNFYIGFALKTDAFVARDGVYIDDVVLTRGKHIRRLQLRLQHGHFHVRAVCVGHRFACFIVQSYLVGFPT